MESHDEKQGIFLQHLKKYAYPILKIDALIQEKSICTTIILKRKKICINVDLVNQLMLSKLDIIYNNTIIHDEKYALKNLQLYVDDYKVLNQFNIIYVVSLEKYKVDIILGSPWLDTLGTFMINTQKNLLAFLYKNKKTVFLDVTLKSSS